MRALEKEWRLLKSAPEVTVCEKYGKSTWKEHMAARLIAKRLSKQDVSDLAASCKALPVDPKDWSPFVHDVSAHLIGNLERDDLVTMLSTRCPRGVGECALEFNLAAQGILENRQTDPILVLGEAYARCQIPDVRRVLIESICRGFGGHGIRRGSDAEFVKNAMQWYQENKDHLTLNWDYWYRELSSPMGDYQQMDPQALERDLASSKGEPLFKEKPASHRTPSRPHGPRRAFSGAPPNASWRACGRTNEQRLADLQGTWEITGVTDNGTLVPIEKFYKGALFVLRKDMLTETASDWKHEFRIRLGPPQEPEAMDLIRTVYELKPTKGVTPSAIDRLIDELNEETTSAIYDLKGDSLRICQPRFGSARRPRSFDAGEGSNEVLFTLKRANGYGRATIIIGLLGFGCAAALAVYLSTKGRMASGHIRGPDSDIHTDSSTALTD
jgi:uncharacterized protein (TIGR03067 family)